MTQKPAKRELLSELEKLREISAKNERLTKEFVEVKIKMMDIQQGDGKIENPEEKLIDLGKEQEKIQLEMDACAKEQSRIVDIFISLSEDQEAIDKFHSSAKTIENLTEKLNEADDLNDQEKIKEEILHKVEDWISCLEVIVTKVIEGAIDTD